MRVAVVVLGDLGRSPRMLYHAEALAAHGVVVDLVGHLESALPDAIWHDPRITVHPVGAWSRSPAQSARGSYLVRASLRGIGLLIRLVRLLLWRLERPDAILVQNPPGVPVLLVAWLVARLRSARFWIDWHNLTSSMLSLKVGDGHPLVTLVAAYEGLLGRRADLNLFVSAAMQQSLVARWQIHGEVFRDRPAEQFQPLTVDERARARQALCARVGVEPSSRFAIAISPTSWTADEDFDLLTEAVAECEALARDQERSDHPFPTLLIVLTGRGVLRKPFEERIAVLRSRSVLLRTIWLEPPEYARALAAADLGLCLHRSTSGLDLPMKVADLFGVGVPVCALNYGPCLSELISQGVNGLLFSTSRELGGQLHALFATFPTDDRTLASLRRGAAREGTDRWQTAWRRQVWPLLTRPSSTGASDGPVPR